MSETPAAPHRTGPDAVRTAYDAVAGAYDAQLRDELDHKPLDRALLTAVTELAGPGTIADVGCGPGHVTRFLAARHADVVGLDLSPAMIDIARAQAPDLRFTVGSMLALPVPPQAWSAAIALYSIIHLTPDERTTAVRELHRVLRPGGSALVAFHVESPDIAPGEVQHVTDWFGETVDLHGYFLDPVVVRADLEAAGFTVTATLERAAVADAEFPSRRSYLLAQRPGNAPVG